MGNHNEFLTCLGINNSNTDKRERLISAEVNSNNQFVSCNVNKMLEARQRACELINAKFGLNISVELRTPQKEENEGSEEVDDNVPA